MDKSACVCAVCVDGWVNVHVEMCVCVCVYVLRVRRWWCVCVGLCMSVEVVVVPRIFHSPPCFVLLHYCSETKQTSGGAFPAMHTGGDSLSHPRLGFVGSDQLHL